MKTLADVAVYLSDKATFSEKPAARSDNDRLDALERRFAELKKLKATNELKLRQFAADPITVPEPHRAERRESDSSTRTRPASPQAPPKAPPKAPPRRNPMTHSDRSIVARFSADPRPTRDVFRSAVDDRVIQMNGDPNDKAARLKAAQDLIRELASVGEVTVAPADYLYGLATQTELATKGQPGAWGYSRPVVTKTTPGGMGGLQARQQVPTPFAEAEPELYGRDAMRAVNAMMFAEAPKVKPKTSAMAHKEADSLAAQHPELVAHYQGRAKVVPLSPELAERLHHHLSKIPTTAKGRLGLAMRNAIADVPGFAPKYGSAGAR